MVTWAKPEAQAFRLRERLIADYEAKQDRHPWWPARVYGPTLARLRAGEPVVFPAWQLYPYDLPPVRTGKSGFYRLEPEGSVVEVLPRRDPNDPLTSVGWDEVRR
jgi:hypothetical protein